MGDYKSDILSELLKATLFFQGTSKNLFSSCESPHKECYQDAVPKI